MLLPDAIDMVRPSVVRIFWFVRDLTPEQLANEQVAEQVRRLPYPGIFGGVLGTGFFVNDDGYVITAAHVLDAAKRMVEDTPDFKVEIGLGLAPPDQEHARLRVAILGGEIVDGDHSHDLALLRTQNGTPFKEPFMQNGEIVEIPHAVARLQPAQPRDGDDIACSGYPLNNMAMITTHGVVAASYWVDEITVPDPDEPNESTLVQRASFLGDLQVNGGNSGGPVYAVADGCVLGMVSGTLLAPLHVSGGDPTLLRAGAGLSIVTPSYFVVEFLERNSVAWTGPDGVVRSGTAPNAA